MRLKPKAFFVLTISLMLVACIFNADTAPALPQQEETQSFIVEEAEAEKAAEPKREPKDYILNTYSYKIHLPSCHSVKLMKEHNKKFVKESIDDLISRGYDPCDNCKPHKKPH